MKISTKGLVRFVLMYLTSIPVLVFIGTANEWFAYVLLFVSSAVLAVEVINETWKGSRPLTEMKYRSRKEGHRNELEQPADRVEELKRSSSKYLIECVRQIFFKRLGLEYGVSDTEAEKLLERPENLLRLVDDENLLKLISEEDPFPKRRDQLLRFLSRVLDRLEAM